MEDLQILKPILLVFWKLSMLKINLDKSTLFEINTSQDLIIRLASMLECKVSEWPLTYLGLPLGGNRKAIAFWDPMIDRVSRRLDGWKRTFLSLGGRITLIQTSVSHIHNYFLSLFKIRMSIVSKIDKLQRDFLCSGVRDNRIDHLISWDLVCKPKEYGGLGLGLITL